MRRGYGGAILLAAALGSRAVAAQESAPATPVARSHETYSGVQRVVETSDAQVVVLDWRAGELWRLPPDLLVQLPLTHAGNGPGETATPVTLIGAGQFVVVWDSRARRFTRCDLSREVVCRTLTHPDVFRPYQLSGVDTAGRICGSVLPPPRMDPGPMRATGLDDSMAVLCWQPETGRIDSIARVGRTPTYVITQVQGNQTNRMIMPVPLVAPDQAAITPSGEVVILDAGGTGLRFAGSSGTRAVALKQPRPAVPYGKGELDSMLLRADSVGAGQSLRASLPRTKGSVAPAGFFTSPTGALWVEVYDAAVSDGRLYDGLSLTGERLGSIRLARRSRLVGVGRTRYFVVQRDDDDLETLLAFALPPWAK